MSEEVRHAHILLALVARARGDGDGDAGDGRVAAVCDHRHAVLESRDRNLAGRGGRGGDLHDREREGGGEWGGVVGQRSGEEGTSEVI